MGTYLRKPRQNRRARLIAGLITGELTLMALGLLELMAAPVAAGMMAALAGYLSYRLGRLDGRKERG